MIRRLFVALVTGSLLVAAGPAATARPHGDVHDQGAYNTPYSFVDSSCDFPVKVRGRTEGKFVNFNVPGSHGQAFLNRNRNHFIEALRNPKNHKRLSAAGRTLFKDVSAHHVRGDIYRFRSVEKVHSYVLRDSKGRVVLREHGIVHRTMLFDTLGDSKPGGNVLKERVTRKSGHLPTLGPGFDWCDVYTKYLR